MKKVLVACLLVVVGCMAFAVGEMEIDSATAGLLDEVTKTVEEGKDIISQYAAPTVKGLMARKVAYFGVVFPLMPIFAAVGLAMIIMGTLFRVGVFDLGRDVDDVLCIILCVIGSFLFLFGGFWSLVDLFELRMFQAAPEVYVLKGLL